MEKATHLRGEKIIRKNELLIAISVLVTMLMVRNIGLDRIPSKITVSILLATPILILWITVKYNKTMFKRSYIKIMFILFVFICYFHAGVWIIDKYYNNYYKQYRDIISILTIASSVAILLAAIVCKILIDLDKTDSKRIKKRK
jgi:hypothetical protein